MGDMGACASLIVYSSTCVTWLSTSNTPLPQPGSVSRGLGLAGVRRPQVLLPPPSPLEQQQAQCSSTRATRTVRIILVNN